MKFPISLDDSNKASPMMSMSVEGPHKNYPRLHLHWEKSYDLPDDGEMTVKFHKSRETNTDGDDGVSQSVELDILSIENVKADKEGPTKKKDRELAEDALDSYAAEVENDE